MSPNATCPAGYYCPPGSASPTPCPAGSYCPAPGALVPTACAAGSYSPAPAAAARCPPCPAGSFCAAATTKETCRAGFYCPAGSTAPLACPVDRCCPDANATESSPCAAAFAFDLAAALASIGDPTAQLAVAQKAFAPASVTMAQAAAAVDKALELAGGFGAPCTKEVAFIAVPGLQLSTVPGQVGVDT